MKYLIWSTDYRHNSGGEKALHLLCHELNLVGQEAYVTSRVTNPEWNTPTAEPPLDGEWCAVYPEVVSGNPWNAPRVARWVLNVPGKLGGDKVYAPSELVFSWSPDFLDGVPLLMLPAYELDIYTDRHLRRSGAVFFVGKGIRTRNLRRAVEITTRLRVNRRRLADALNRATVMYSFDNVTGMADIARLCGCPVVMIPDGETAPTTDDGIGWDTMPRPFDSTAYRARIVALKDTFYEQLAAFVRITQAA